MQDLKPQPLASLLRDHSYLFNNPLNWTSLHLTMVGCRFMPLELLEYPENDQNDSNARQVQSEKPFVPTNEAPTENLERKSRRMHPWDRWRSRPAPERLESKTWHVHERFIALRDVLQYEGSALKLDSARPKFYFAGKAIKHRPKCAVFRRCSEAVHTPSDKYQVLIGYFYYPSVRGGRLDLFGAQPHPDERRCNTPVLNLNRKKLDKLKPANEEEDPYLAFILLCIAQLHRRSLKTADQSMHTARLLVLNYPETGFIDLYEAQFSSELLEALERPKAATSYIDWPTITGKKIPIKPHDTFRQRLEAELLSPPNRQCDNSSEAADSAGHESKIEKRQREQEDELRSVKRKMDVVCGT